MKGNKRADTKPELALRSALHALGYRYRKDFRIDLPLRRVAPGHRVTKRKIAVFVDGCFWHACPSTAASRRTTSGYWSPKLAKNVERDRAADAALTQAGWTVIRLWEHVPVPDAVAAVVAVLAPPVGTSMDDHAGILPSTLPALADVLREGAFSPALGARVRGHPALREAYASGDEEELEYIAMLAAARESLRHAAGRSGTPPRRRVVLAGRHGGDLDRLRRRARRRGHQRPGVPRRARLRHIDDPDAERDIAAASPPSPPPTRAMRMPGSPWIAPRAMNLPGTRPRNSQTSFSA